MGQTRRDGFAAVTPFPGLQVWRRQMTRNLLETELRSLEKWQRNGSKNPSSEPCLKNGLG